tara:strand:- start:1749 stop:2030 length:282 start_codon:yes stop_codon:yes gene_type:complete
VDTDKSGLDQCVGSSPDTLNQSKEVQVFPCSPIAGFFDSLPRDFVRFIAVSKSQVRIQPFAYFVVIRINVQASGSNDNPNRYLGSPRSSSGSR